MPPRLSLQVNAKRVENVRQTRCNKQRGEILPRLGGSAKTGQKPPTEEAVAADLMGVSYGYVGQALRRQKDARAPFEQVLVGTLSLQTARRQLDGVPDAKSAAQVRALRTRFSAA